MPGPRRAGAVVFARDLESLSRFYQEVFGLRLVTADTTRHVIESDDIQLIVHAIPAHIAATFSIATPPERRDEAAIKLFFTVPSLTAAEATAKALGGDVFGAEWQGPGFRARDGYDNEGNVFQLRESVS